MTPSVVPSWGCWHLRGRLVLSRRSNRAPALLVDSPVPHGTAQTALKSTGASLALQQMKNRERACLSHSGGRERRRSHYVSRELSRWPDLERQDLFLFFI